MSSRLQGVDAARFIALVAVVAIHTGPFSRLPGAYQYLSISINQAARFAVPFFFVVSGYFFSSKLKTEVGGGGIEKAFNFVLRLLQIWLFWSTVYLIPFDSPALIKMDWPGLMNSFLDRLLLLTNNPVYLLFVGTQEHLWYLIALACSAMIAAFVYRYAKHQLLTLCTIGMALFIFGVCAKAYSMSPIGINLDFNTRNGPFFGTIFFAIGVLLSSAKTERNLYLYGACIAILGLVVSFIEVFAIYNKYHIWPAKQDFVFSTVLLGSGFSMMAIFGRPPKHWHVIGKIGKYSLGIYASHYIFVDLMRGIDSELKNPIWSLAYPSLVLLFSTGLTLIACKNRWLAKFFK